MVVHHFLDRDPSYLALIDPAVVEQGQGVVVSNEDQAVLPPEAQRKLVLAICAERMKSTGHVLKVLESLGRVDRSQALFQYAPLVGAPVALSLLIAPAALLELAIFPADLDLISFSFITLGVIVILS